MNLLQKETKLSLIIDTGIVAVIRAKDGSDLLGMVIALEKAASRQSRLR